MTNSAKNNWFSGSGSIETDLDKINGSLDNIGTHFLSTVREMSGIQSAELIEEDDQRVTIRTNEGLMERGNIKITQGSDSSTLEYDESYAAGKLIKTNAHFTHVFQREAGTIKHILKINNLKTKGVLGFFYKMFGSSNIGNDFLASYRTYFERPK